MVDAPGSVRHRWSPWRDVHRRCLAVVDAGGIAIVATMFTQEALAKVVAETLPPDPRPGEKVVVGLIDDRGVQVVAGFKMNDRWELQALARHTWAGDNQVGAKVLLRW